MSASHSHTGHTSDKSLHVARLTMTPMKTVKMQPTAVYHRNDILNIGLSTSLHRQTTGLVLTQTHHATSGNT